MAKGAGQLERYAALYALFPPLYARGMGDYEIAEACDCAAQTVYRWRKRTGRPATDGTPAGRRRHLARCVAGLARRGYGAGRSAGTILTAVRMRALRLRCLDDGWPAGCLPGHASRLAALEAGPATGPEVLRRLGLKLCSQNTRPLRECRQAGWAVVVGYRRPAWKGKWAPVYDLAPEVKAERARLRANRAGGD